MPDVLTLAALEAAERELRARGQAVTHAALAERLGVSTKTIQRRYGERARGEPGPVVARPVRWTPRPPSPKRQDTGSGPPPAPAAAALSTASVRPLGDPLTDLADVLPAAHLAMVRLVVAAIVARWHLAAAPSGTGGRPAFAAYGAGGRGKTRLAELVRHVFGWPSHWPIVVPLHGVQAGELAGRRTTAGRGRWRFDPAPYLALPFACCDELDKARSRQVANEAFGLISSDGTWHREGARIAVRPVILLTFNLPAKGPSPLLTTQWRRRTIGLDVDRAELPQRERVAAWLAAQGPRLDLDTLRPAPAEPAADAAILAGLRAELTDDGLHHVEPRMVGELLSGWAAIWPDDPAGELLAALLTLAGTRGELRGTRASAFAPGPTAAQQAAEARTRALELAGLQAPAVADLDRMARLMWELADDPDYPELHGQARRLAGQLGELRRMTAAAASVDDLRAIAELPAARAISGAAAALCDYAGQFVDLDRARVEDDDQDDDQDDGAQYRPGLMWMPGAARPLPATEPGTGRLIGSRRLTLPVVVPGGAMTAAGRHVVLADQVAPLTGYLPDVLGSPRRGATRRGGGEAPTLVRTVLSGYSTWGVYSDGSVRVIAP